MKRICSWIFIAVTIGVLAGCAGMSSSIYESTPIVSDSFPPSSTD